MPQFPGSLLSHLRDLAAPPGAVADAQLLERFAARGEEAAFSQLVRRHGAMVLGVCRRLLRQEPDVEDAFQATFLVLARRAAAIRKTGSLGSWLHGVAWRVAMRARADTARRAVREQSCPATARADHSEEVSWAEVRAILDEELARLPARYRAPLVQCYLEGQTQDEAARQLGWSPRTLRRRLGRARDLLRARLEGRGLALAAGLLTVAVAERVGVPDALAGSVTRAAVLIAAARPTAGAVSAAAVRLAEGALQGTLLSRLGAIAATLLIILTLAGGAWLAWGRPASPPPATAVEDSQTADRRAAATLDAQGDPLPAGALARLGTERFRHGGPVEALSLSADGKRLATGADDGTIRFWDVQTGKLLRRWDGLGAFVMGFSVALSPDSKVLATSARTDGAGGPEQVALWDTATGKELRRLGEPLASPCSRLAFSPDGKLVAGGEWESGKVLVWDAETGKEIKGWKAHAGTVTAVAFADARRLVTGGDNADKAVRVWDATTGAQIRSFTAHKDRVLCATVSPDAKVLATGAADATARLWDLASGKEMDVLKGHEYGVGAVAFSPDGKTLLTGGHDGRIRLWEVATGKELRQVPGRQGGITGIFFTADGKQIVAGGYDSTVRVRDIETGKDVHAFVGHEGPVAGVAYSPDGKLLATAGSDRTVRLWSCGKEIRRLIVGGPGGGASAVTFSPDGKTLAAAAFQGVTLWDAATGKELRRLEGHKGWVLCLFFAPDGRSLASGGDDKTVRLWDPATGNELRRIDGHDGSVRTIAISPDGKMLATGGGFPTPETIRLWDPTTGKALAGLPATAGTVTGLTFSPDGTVLATVSEDYTVRLWDVGKRTLVRSWKADDGLTFPTPLSFSPDGRLLITGSNARVPDKPWAVVRMVRVWEISSGKERCSFRGQDGPIQAVAVSPDGTVIASGSEDTTVLLWDLAGRLRVEK
jgi:RNA polymerase sigma factor (sigma-70 family)